MVSVWEEQSKGKGERMQHSIACGPRAPVVLKLEQISYGGC